MPAQSTIPEGFEIEPAAAEIPAGYEVESQPSANRPKRRPLESIFAGQISEARTNGYSDDEIVNYLGSSRPDLAPKFRKAKANRYSSTEMLVHLAGEGAQPQKSDLDNFIESLPPAPSRQTRDPLAQMLDDVPDDPRARSTSRTGRDLGQGWTLADEDGTAATAPRPSGTDLGGGWRLEEVPATPSRPPKTPWEADADTQIRQSLALRQAGEQAQHAATAAIPKGLDSYGLSLARLKAEGKLKPELAETGEPGVRAYQPTGLDYMRRFLFGGPQGETAPGRAFPSMSGAKITDTPTTELPLARFEELIPSESQLGHADLPPDIGPGIPNPLATPISRAVTRGVATAGTSLLTPENAEMLVATKALGVLGPAAPLLGRVVNAGVSGYFAYKSAMAAEDAAKKAWEAHQAGDDEAAAELSAQAATNAAFAATAGHHAARSGVALSSDIANRIEAHNENAAASVLADAAQHWGEEPPPEDFAQPQPTGAPKGKRPVSARTVTPSSAEPEQTPAPPEPPPPSDTERVSPATPNPPTAAQPTAPESPDTLEIQLQQLAQGQRKAVMFPKGTLAPDTYPPGTAVTHDKFGNIYVYRNDLTTRSAVRRAAKDNALPELLGSAAFGMGAPDKSELPGDAPVVVGRTADGTEVQSTATSPEHLETTVAATQAVTPPDGTVNVEPAEQVIGERLPSSQPQLQPKTERQADIQAQAPVLAGDLAAPQAIERADENNAQPSTIQAVEQPQPAGDLYTRFKGYIASRNGRIPTPDIAARDLGITTLAAQKLTRRLSEETRLVNMQERAPKMTDDELAENVAASKRPERNIYQAEIERRQNVQPTSDLAAPAPIEPQPERRSVPRATQLTTPPATHPHVLEDATFDQWLSNRDGMAGFSDEEFNELRSQAEQLTREQARLAHVAQDPAQPARNRQLAKTGVAEAHLQLGQVFNRLQDCGAPGKMVHDRVAAESGLDPSIWEAAAGLDAQQPEKLEAPASLEEPPTRATTSRASAIHDLATPPDIEESQQQREAPGYIAITGSGLSRHLDHVLALGAGFTEKDGRSPVLPATPENIAALRRMGSNIGWRKALGVPKEPHSEDLATPASLEPAAPAGPVVHSQLSPETETIKPDEQVQNAVRPADRRALATELPEGSGSAGESGIAGEQRGRSSGTRRGGTQPRLGKGTAVQPSRRTGEPGVGQSPDPEPVNFPPRAGNVTSTRFEHDYRIPDRVISGSPETRARNNVAAIQVLRKLQAENRPATLEEKDILANYVGWGAVPQLFAGNTPEWRALQQELKTLISPEEYESAQRSTTNAHYTGHQEVDAIWNALVRLGAKPGMTWLEPAEGVGNFWGRMPAELLEGARRIGVEKDALTSAIARYLYPDTGHENKGFEESELPSEYFDAVISNVPFGNYPVHDPAFKGKPYLTSSIHNYYFAKALDLVRPGGMVAFITSRYTMDGQKPGHRAVREYIHSKADLLGAIRLPTDAFQQSSGTHVITDVLFLRKCLPGGEPAGQPWRAVEDKILQGRWSKVPIGVNEYYHAHPDHVLGEEKTARGQFSDSDYTVEGRVTPESLDAALRKALSTDGFREFETRKPSRSIALAEVAGEEAKKIGGLFFDEQGQLFRKTSKGSAEPIDAPKATAARIKGQLGIRDALAKLIAAEQNDAPTREIEEHRQSLNKLYDSFVKAHGPLSSQSNVLAMRGDPDAPLLTSLEAKYSKKSNLAEKQPIFSKRIFQPKAKVASAADAKEAMYVALNETGRIDWNRMSELTGKPEDALQRELRDLGLVYLDPKSRVWLTSEEYLSGAVRAKLKEAQQHARLEPQFSENVKALQAVQPEDIPPSKINATPGVTWVPLRTYGEFIKDVLNADRAPTVHYVAGQFHFEAPFSRSASKWSTKDVSAYELLYDTLNLRRTKVYEVVDKKPVLDKDATLAAIEKQKQIAESFNKWLFADAQRAEEVTRIYNDMVNDLRLRTYDGSHLTLPEMSRAVLRGGDLEPYQKAAVWRQIVQPNVLLAHTVGSGKTFEMIVGGMEIQRLGLIKRPMYVVPNSTLTGWQQQFAMIYPQKRVLVFSEKDLEKKKRQSVIAQIATGDWDAVVVPHSSFQFIPVSDETFDRHYQALANQLEESIAGAVEAGMDTRMVKRLEKQKERILANLKDRRNEAKQDKTVNWEQLGIDQLFVDEAHEYKKLGFSTKQGTVAGIDPNGNQKTFDLLMKVRHTQQAGRGVTMASGTPVTNTMGELYNVMQYLIQPELDARGIGRFDEWAATFGRIKDVFEPKAEGGGYKTTPRFSKFVNVADLAQLFRSFSDVLTSDMLDIPRPVIAGGERRAVVNELNEDQLAYMKHLQERAAAIRTNARKALPDNMAAIYTDAQKMALDVRTVNPDAADHPDSRVNQAAREIYKYWQQSHANKGTQLVFADFGKPKSAGGQTFSVYDDLIEKLIDMGIPASDIAHVYTAKTKAQRAELFQKVNDGQVRVLLGSTGKMGVGVNVQQRVLAMHHLTLPHRPADLEQREGRGIRQGNENPEVHILYYVTKGSLDELKFANVARKARSFAQFMQGKANVREMEDVDDMAPSLEAFQAAASGDPRVMRKLEVDNELNRLGVLYAEFRDEQWARQRELNQIPKQIASAEQDIANYRKNIATRDKTGRVWKIGKQTYEGEGVQKKAAEALAKRITAVKQDRGFEELGTAYGLPLLSNSDHIFIGSNQNQIQVSWNLDDATAKRTGVNAVGTLTKIENVIKNLEGHIRQREDFVAQKRKDEKTLTDALEEKWPNQQAYDDLQKEQQELYRALGGEKSEAVAGNEDIPDASVETDDRAEEELAEPAESAESEGAPERAAATTKESASVKPGASVTLGSGFGALHEPLAQLYRKDIAPGVRNISTRLRGALDDLQKVLAPQTRGASARKAAGLIREMGAEIDQRRDRAVAALEAFRQHFDRLPKEHGVHGLAVYDAIEAGRLHLLSPVERAFADAARKLFDGRKQELSELGLVQSYIEDYLPHEYKQPDQAAIWIHNWHAKRPLAGSEAFRKQRTYPTLREALEDPEFTLEARFDNPVDFVLSKLGQMDKSINAHLAFEELYDEGWLQYIPAHGKIPAGLAPIDDRIFTVYGPKYGAVKIEPPRERADLEPPPEIEPEDEIARTPNVHPDDVRVLGRREMGRYYAAQPLAQVINNHLSPGISHSNLMRAWRAVNNTLNMIDLSASYYHGLTTTLNSSFSDMALGMKQLLYGKPVAGATSIARGFTPFGSAVHDVFRGTQIQRVWDGKQQSADPLTVAIVDALKQGGGKARQDLYYATNFTKGMTQSWNEPDNPIGAAWGAVWRAPFAALEQTMKPIMEYMVPRAKLGAFAKLAQLEIEKNPQMGLDEARERFGKMWDAIDDRFGQLSQRNMLMNATVRDVMNALVGRPGWNIGTARALVGGAADALRNMADLARGRTPQISDRTLYLIALVLGGAAINGLVTYLLTGTAPHGNDFVFPRDGGTTEDGRPSRIVLPTYIAKDLYSYFTHPLMTLKAKAAPALTIAGDITTNRNFQQQKIGGRGGIGYGKYLASAVTPYAIQGLQKNRERAASPARQLLPFVGILPAGKRVGLSKAEQIITEYMDEQRASTRPAPTAHSRARVQVFQTARAGDIARAQQIGYQAIAQGTLTQQDVRHAMQRARQSPLVNDFQRLPLSVALEVYDAATPKERQQIQRLARNKVVAARAKPYEWDDDTRALAAKYFGVRPPVRHATGDFAMPASLE